MAAFSGQEGERLDQVVDNPHRVALLCAAFSVFMAGLAAFVIMEPQGFRASALVRMAAGDPISGPAVESDPEFVVYPSDHYDGIYFYAMARDPFATGIGRTLIDLPGARYGHVLYSWVAAVLSLGQAKLIPLALLVINLTSMGVAAWAVSMLARDMGWSPWAGLMVAVNPGFLYAITVDTSEVFGSMLAVLFLLAWFRQRWILATVALVATCMAKEIFVFLPIGLGVWELLKVARGRGRADAVSRLVLLSTGPLALFIWHLYLRQALGYWAFTDDLHVLTAPFAGWAETFRLATTIGNGGGGFEAVQIAAASVPLLLAVGAALLIGVGFASRLRGPLDVAFLGMALLSFSLTWRNLYFAKDMIRQMSPVLLLLPAVVAGFRSGSPLHTQEQEPPA